MGSPGGRPRPVQGRRHRADPADGALARVARGRRHGGRRARAGAGVTDLLPGVPRALSPLVRRIIAPNPGMMTGPGTNTYLVGIDEVAVVDPGPEDEGHLDAILGCGGDRIRWVLCT